jgi:hypothetical protein
VTDALTRFVVVLALSAGCAGGARDRPDSATRAPEAADRAADSTASAPSSVDSAASAASAVAVVRDYYDAIRARDYPRAYALWEDAERATGQSLEDFRRGFAQTVSVELTVGTPSRVEGAAGSRYVDVPVEVAAAQRDGTMRHFRGRYTLRRVVVPGATTAQQSWRLYSAHLAPVQ